VSGGSRAERVAEEFREILAEEIPRLKDPRVGFVTVTHVEVTPDLRKATVFYTALGQDRDQRRTRAGLDSARAHLRAVLGHQVRMKFTPDLEFQEDLGLAQVERVHQLLKEIGVSGEEPDGEKSGEGSEATEEGSSP
jgi:ribosome-binding factor A